MIAFDRPNKAFRKYEASLMRPVHWPPTKHAVPALWDRARALFADTLRTIGSAMQVAYRQVFKRKQRRHLLIRLEPVERLVRILLMTEAITFLLMTPQGLKLRQTTKPCAIPAPPPPVGVAKPPPAQAHFHAAMMTIAALQPRIDPRIAAREQREERARREAAQYDLLDVRPLNGQFRVIRWVHAREPETRAPQSALPRITVLDDDTLAADPVPSGDGDWEEVEDLRGPMLGVARRIAALERVLANPRPAILRLARRIAAIPREYFECPVPQCWRISTWWHGGPEIYNACNLRKSAFDALDRAYGLRPFDPG